MWVENGGRRPDSPSFQFHAAQNHGFAQDFRIFIMIGEKAGRASGCQGAIERGQGLRQTSAFGRGHTTTAGQLGSRSDSGFSKMEGSVEARFGREGLALATIEGSRSSAHGWRLRGGLGQGRSPQAGDHAVNTGHRKKSNRRKKTAR